MKTREAARGTAEASIMKASMQTLRERLVNGPWASDMVLRSIGSEFGSEVARSLAAESIEGVVRELGAYWVGNGLGRIRWVDRKKRVILVEESEPSEEQTDGQRRLCPFKKGYLEAVLKERLGGGYTVRELRTDSTTGCVFRIEG